MLESEQDQNLGAMAMTNYDYNNDWVANTAISAQTGFQTKGGMTQATAKGGFQTQDTGNFQTQMTQEGGQSLSAAEALRRGKQSVKNF